MANELSSYLQRLKFEPRLSEGFFASLMTNIRITLLLVIGIIVMGIFALVSLPRRINPEVNIPIVFISTIFPGASPLDVESLVTVPIENALAGIEGIDQVSSSSQENASTIVVEFSSRVNVDEATADVQQAVDGVNDLPTTALTPNVQALDFEDVPVLQIALVSKTDQASLNIFAKQLADQIEDLPQIQRVQTVGLYQSEVEILIDPSTYSTYNINPLQLQQAIKNAIQQYPVGSVKTNGHVMAVAVEVPGDSLAILRQIPLTFGTTKVILGEIADVTLKTDPDTSPSYYSTGNEVQAAVSISAYKTVSAELEDSALAARELVAKSIENQQGQYEYKVITDFAKDIDDQFGDLIYDFSSSIALVFITLLLFLGIRQASLASFVIPLSFLATFASMYFFDIQLSFLSLFSLLLGLGMIVDDAIVMISAMTDYYASGKFTPKQTALLVWSDFKAPTLSSNLTNVWSFLPLLIATGIIGEFTKVISIVVSVALITSTAISLIVTIPLMSAVLKPHIPRRVKFALTILGLFVSTVLVAIIMSGNQFLGLIILLYLILLVILKISWNQLKLLQNLPLFTKLIAWLNQNQISSKLFNGFFSAKEPIRKYKQSLHVLLSNTRAKRRMILAVILLAVGSYLLVPLGLVKQEFFPSVDQERLYVTLKLPTGTAKEITQSEALELLKKLSTYEVVDYALLDLGASADFSSVNQRSQGNRARFSLVLNSDRNLTSIEFAQQVRDDFSAYTKGEIQVVEESSGPPAGADAQITLLGDDLALLQQSASQVEAYLKQRADVGNVQISVEPGLSRITFQPNINTLNQLGLDPAQVANSFRTYVSELDLGELRASKTYCNEECPIKLRLHPDVMSADDLGKLTIVAQQTNHTFASLGSFVLQESPTVVNRLDGQRSITISGDVIDGANQVQVGKELIEHVDKTLDLPPGVTWQTGGVNEENQRSVNSIIQAMLVSAILIMGTMVVELKSFRRALIVMLVIPLAISGVFIVFALFRIPLSFPALIGVLALFGIVVKNAILIIDKINLNLEIGLPFEEAIADGSSSRLEPIIFSSVTNIIGLVPITISDPLWRGLGGAIISGLTLSGIIMLFFIPLVYHSWFKPETTRK